MPNVFTQMVDVFTLAYSQQTNVIWYGVNEDEFYQNQTLDMKQSMPLIYNTYKTES